MLGKLALRNAKRSFKDYLVYMITITISFALIFSFNAAIFSKDILELSDMMDSFQGAIVAVSIIVVIIIGWLINYTMRFMLEKRSHEFGTYAVLGIDNKRISKLFMLENLTLGIISLLLSLVVGLFLYQILVAIVFNVFDLPYQISLNVTWQSVLLTLFYFIIIFAFSLWHMRHKLKKMKVYDLLYFDKKNENAALKKRKNKTIICVLSLICGIISIVLLFNSFKIGVDPNMGNILIALILVIICIYGFYFTAASLITSFFLNKRRKYKGQNLFIVRNFASKINTMGVTLGTLGLLFCLTFISMNVGMFMKGLFDEQIMRMAPYDISVFNPEDDDNFETVLTKIESDYTIEDKIIYKAYYSDSNTFTKISETSGLGYQNKDSFLKLSDYNKLREMRGMEPVTLEKDKYLIHSMSNHEKSFNEVEFSKLPIVLNDQALTFEELLTEGFSTEWIPGCTFIIVVNDEYVSNLNVINTILGVNTKEETNEDFQRELNKMVQSNLYIDDAVYSLANVTVKGAVISQNKSVLITFSFSLFYLAFIFTATAGTILSIQQLSDSAKYKFRYKILDKLGMGHRTMDKLIFKQLLIFFIFPVLLPLIISLVASIATYQIFVPVIENANLLWQVIGINILLFMFIYVIYFIATYIGFRKNVYAEK